MSHLTVDILPRRGRNASPVWRDGDVALQRPLRPIAALPTLRPSHLLPRRGARELLPFPLSAPAHRVHTYYLARAGIAAGLSAYRFPPGSACLLPAYHHGVEVEAVRAAGLEPRFYPIGSRLEVDLDDLRARLDGRVRVLYLTHFAGFPGPVREMRALADDYGLVFLEDCALAFGSSLPTGEPLGTIGDLAVFCLYKSVPVPHGGVLVSPRPPPLVPRRPSLWATASHLAGSLLSTLERQAGEPGARVRALGRRLGRAVPIEARTPVGRQHLAAHELMLGASRLVPGILARQPYPAIVARRRRNYRRLVERIGAARVPTGALRPGTCPLFVPVRVCDRGDALARLGGKRIEAIDLWRQGCEDAAEFPAVAALRRHVIELPCHQDLDDDDVDRLAAALEEIA
jgi:hypothetical protein